jgi:hypothetical protein
LSLIKPCKRSMRSNFGVVGYLFTWRGKVSSDVLRQLYMRAKTDVQTFPCANPFSSSTPHFLLSLSNGLIVAVIHRPCLLLHIPGRCCCLGLSCPIVLVDLGCQVESGTAFISVTHIHHHSHTHSHTH